MSPLDRLFRAVQCDLGTNLTESRGVESERLEHRFELRSCRSALGGLHESRFEYLGFETSVATVTAADDKALRTRIPRLR
jgi:hypothetical protein